MNVLRLLPILFYAASTETLFQLSHDEKSWFSAHRSCNLTVLDTEEKRSTFFTSEISTEDQPWIGFLDPIDGQYDVYKWLTGTIIPDNDNNWKDENPDKGYQACGLLTNTGKWADWYCSSKRRYICEVAECCPGYYKVEDHSRCDLCPRNTIKISAGNRLNCSIDQACDGVTNVPSSDHSKCECKAGYYRSASTSCILCPGNRIKSQQGDTTDCSPCNRRSFIPNPGHTTCVSCVTLISGNGAGLLVDNTTDHCTAVPQSLDGVSVQYELSVNSACGNGNDVTVHVTVEQYTDCNDLVSALSVKESDDNCSKNSMIMKRCSLITSGVEPDKKVCRLRCKCADSEDTCLLQIYWRGLVPNPSEIKICEIEIETP